MVNNMNFNMQNVTKLIITSLFCLLGNVIYAPEGPVVAHSKAADTAAEHALVARLNPWSIMPNLTLSKSLKGQIPDGNLPEISAVETEIMLITECLQKIQGVLGENFNGKESKSPLTPRELRSLRLAYKKMIDNYTRIISLFGATDHYYMPLSPQDYDELLNLINHFAEKAGLGKLQKVMGQPLQSAGG